MFIHNRCVLNLLFDIDDFFEFVEQKSNEVSFQGSGWRPEFSESIRQLLVEELKMSNSDFPAQIFFSRFLRRRAEHQRQFTAAGLHLKSAAGFEER